MEKEINLVEILKDCPEGTKLYSTIHGEVELSRIVINDEYPIEYKCKNINDDTFEYSVAIDGRYSIFNKGECTLFPSKDQRDWSKFNIEPKFDPKSLQPFDKVLVRNLNKDYWNPDFFSMWNTDTNNYRFISRRLYNQIIPYNDETKHLAGTTNDCPEFYKWWEN